MPADHSTAAPTRCPNCGAVLPPHAPQGLCPRCLFAGLAASTGDAPSAAAPTPEELAPHFPQLEILECLGRGGMGVVYRARQRSLNRLVALKLLAPERAGDPQFAARFEKEAQALAALNHPHIVTIHDFGQAGGFYFLLMEFVDGVNLRQAMKAGRFTPEQALAIVPPVCEALQYAHEHGIVHRDIKPENLLLDREGRVKIADFGIAKMLGAESTTGLTESQPAGTPQYMAPEQRAHRATDHRADIYSLGVVLYELLTGELPANNLQPPSRKVQIDVRLDEIVLRALESTPELRFQTAAEFRTQVEAAVAGAGDAPRDTKVPRIPASAAWAAAVVLLSFAILVLCLVVGAVQGHSGGETPWLIAALAAAAAPLVVARVGAEKPAARRTAWDWLRPLGWSAAIFALPCVGFGAFFLLALVEERGGWNPAPAEAIVVPAFWIAMVLMPWAAVTLFRAAPPRARSRAENPWPRRIFWLLMILFIVPAIMILVPLLAYQQSGRSSADVTRFDIAPVGVNGNVVVVDVKANVASGSVELRVNFTGPRLPPEAQAALEETRITPQSGTLIKPTTSAGNQTSRIVPAGRHTWRLSFALPTADLAKQAYDNLRPFGPLPAEPGRNFAGTLFEVRAPDGQEFGAALQAGPPLTSADPRWFQVLGHSQQDASTVTLTWEVFASQSGFAQFSRAGSPIVVLKPQGSPRSRETRRAARARAARLGHRHLARPRDFRPRCASARRVVRPGVGRRRARHRSHGARSGARAAGEGGALSHSQTLAHRRRRRSHASRRRRTARPERRRGEGRDPSPAPALPRTRESRDRADRRERSGSARGIALPHRSGELIENCACQTARRGKILNAVVKRSTSLDSVFAALADPTRRRILEGLMDGCACVGRLAQPFKVSAPAVSRHLRVLERAGLVRRTRRGRIHEMTLAAEPLRCAADWLDTYRRHWEASLDALARYLETGRPKRTSSTKTKPKRPKRK